MRFGLLLVPDDSGSDSSDSLLGCGVHLAMRMRQVVAALTS